ncbi:MAG: hypothetical protein KA731_03225 [Candidatus Moranbacteria bacterium]|nr:hypothetical protein [Candidatus Moranbacteria bacterium]
MPNEKMKFREIFRENESEELTLIFPVEVKGKKFDKGHTFCATDELGGVNFHKYRYLDLAVVKEEGNDTIKILGFFPGA